MSSKHNGQNTLENIAAELTALASDLTQGKLRVGNRLVSVGNPLFIKTKQKVSGDTAHFTLSFQVPLLDSDKEALLTANQKHLPEKTHTETHDKGMRLQGRPPEGKKIKKEITRLWKSVFKTIEQGQPPAPAEEKALVAAFENYTVFSEPAWHEDWLACFAVLREALTYAHKGDMHTALEYATKVNALTKACHKNHK